MTFVPIWRALSAALALSMATTSALSCTGISLRASDDAVVVARTVEWALSDAAHDSLVLFPRNHVFTAQTPDGYTGLRWSGRHGFISLRAYDQDYGPDGMNEAGLYVGMYYFPGFADFAPYDRNLAGRSLSVGDLMRWMLSSFETVAQVRAGLDNVRVVNVDDPRFGGAALPFHWKIADATGASIVIEIVEGGQVRVHDAVLGVITNSPTYDWHVTNLRNYLGLTQGSKPTITLDHTKLAPLGAGSGFLGLPGDFTPPSRFVRAAAFVASVRPLATAEDAVYEAFRILDSFNIPLGSLARTDEQAADIPGATQITTAADLKNRVLYFHTMANRQVQKLDLKQIDFSNIERQVLNGGARRTQAVHDITQDVKLGR
jgi:choloylglycine hydrolase